jgi:hypothetical protein
VLQPFSAGPRNCLGRKYVISLGANLIMITSLLTSVSAA